MLRIEFVSGAVCRSCATTVDLENVPFSQANWAGHVLFGVGASSMSCGRGLGRDVWSLEVPCCKHLRTSAYVLSSLGSVVVSSGYSS